MCYVTRQAPAAAAPPTAENIITKEYDVGWVLPEKEGPLIDRLLAHAVAATTAAEVSDQTTESYNS